MRQQILQKISPILFEDKLLISFSKEWLKIFGKIPDFDVIIDKDNRLHLVGPKIQ